MKIIYSSISDIELTHEDLVSLISAGITDGDNNFGIDYDPKHYEALPKESRSKDDCLEDKIAKILLSGGKVRVTDYDAEGVKYEGANLKAKVLNNEESVRYDVDLNAIRSGLINAANGTTLDYGGEAKYLKEAFEAFCQDEEESLFDAEYAMALWQAILFNEVVYG